MVGVSWSHILTSLWHDFFEVSSTILQILFFCSYLTTQPIFCPLNWYVSPILFIINAQVILNHFSVSYKISFITVMNFVGEELRWGRVETESVCYLRSIILLTNFETWRWLWFQVGTIRKSILSNTLHLDWDDSNCRIRYWSKYSWFLLATTYPNKHKTAGKDTQVNPFCFLFKSY